MKNLFLFLAFVLVLPTGLSAQSGYDPNYVEVRTVDDGSFEYDLIYMRRGESGKRIKVKYFAAPDTYSGDDVPERFEEWKKGRSIIAATSGTYVDDYNNPTPDGLTIDNGVVVNRSLQSFDGLVIVYATGGMVATDIEEGNLNIGSGSLSGSTIDIKNSWQRSQFIDWSEDQNATVFQTHLLAYDDELRIPSYSSDTKRERRFLAVGYEYGELVYAIVHSKQYTTLYEGTKRVKNYLNNYMDMEIVFMVNLDTGFQDVFNVWEPDGSLNYNIKGEKSLRDAYNLLVFYWE